MFKSCILLDGCSGTLWIQYNWRKNSFGCMVSELPSYFLVLRWALEQAMAHQHAPADYQHVLPFVATRTSARSDPWPSPARSEGSSTCHAVVHHLPHPVLKHPLPHPTPQLPVFLWNMCNFLFKLGAPEPWRTPQVSVEEAAGYNSGLCQAARTPQTHKHWAVTY